MGRDRQTSFGDCHAFLMADFVPIILASPIGAAQDGPLQEIEFPVNSIRVGAVSYLNSKPLIENWTFARPPAELSLDLPSRLADGLGRGQFDVALIPSVEYFGSRATQLFRTRASPAMVRYGA